MNFVPTLLHSSLFWWFVPLAAIPLLLHLLTLHRLKTVELSTFRFLFDSYVQQRRRMQFLEALLAILRTLFLLFLVWMISRPVVKHWNSLFGATGGGGGREVLFLVDCSASMNSSTAGVSAFDRAKTAALSVVERLRPEDRLTLVRIGSRPEEVFSRFSTDTKGIREKIENLKTTSSRANVFATLQQLFGSEASRRTNPLVYLFTDCQSSSWHEVRNQGLDRVIPAGTPFIVVNVGSPDGAPNRAVLGNAPRRNRAVVGLPFVLTPRVANYSKTEDANLTLSVFIDEKEVARTPLKLKPGETVVRHIVYTPREPGIRRGRFEITGKAPDRFPEDDRFLFTLTVQPRIRVVLVNGNPSADPLIDEARFLYLALTSRAEVDAGLAPKPGVKSTREIQRSLDVREVSEVGLTQDVLRDASVVVLANCGGLNASHFEWLRGFVAKGGGLLIFPGDRVNATVYNTQFFPVPGPQGERLTAATLEKTEGDPEKVETFELFAMLDYAHPALTVFDVKDSDARHFKTVRVYKRFKLQLPAKGGRGTWPLIRFANGAPALVESHLGDGTVLLAAFPAHRRWTSLPAKPDFVPLMLRLVSHAEHRPEVEVPPVVVADGTAEINASATWAPAQATIKDPAGHAVTEPLERSGARLLYAYEQTARRGYYTVDVRSERGGRAADLAFAVNLAPEESDFNFLKEPDLKKLLPGASLTYVDASAEAQQLKGSIGKEVEIWPFLIWALFAIIGIEFFLSTLSGRGREGEEGATLGGRIMQMSPGSWVGRMTGGRKEAAD